MLHFVVRRVVPGDDGTTILWNIWTTRLKTRHNFTKYLWELKTSQKLQWHLSYVQHKRNILNKFPNISHSAHKWAIHFQYTVHQLSSSTGLITSSNVSSLVYFQQGYQRSNNNLKKQAELVTLFCIKCIKKEHNAKCIFRWSPLLSYLFIY